ncbi:hypothetical protein PUW25_25285 (plasmid) [Paenibacillus urinalis]|uniref:Uncharacterized protein n=1 Tax=Paenibacillus urinalis TaxID=521520 RepID=A0ABY7XHE5_9BACL|nr:hypothetical protein [Paenibacillus urinalis]WDI05124.1 hypothetical protein PUW25_25285 [Paenibacillus urinalis]
MAIYSSRRKPSPQGNLYKRPDNRVEYQIFNEDYFSGADVNLFFGDIWVDEATSIQFALSEQVLPVYGYHSYTMDTVARGQRMVQGQFSINFKGVGYLKEVLKNATAINYAVNQAQQEGVIKKEDFKKYKLDEILTMYGKESFEQIAEEYEAALWGTSDDESRLTNPYTTFFPADPYGFDIKINYGAVSESLNPGTQFFTTAGSFRTPANVTVETVNGVQLNGLSKVGIGTSFEGQPITEVYNFIARDINGPLYVR